MPTMYWKLIGGGILAVLVGIAVASWLARGREIVRLSDWQATVIDTTTLATVDPDDKGRRKLLSAAQVPGAIAALKRSFDNASTTLATIDAAALKDKAISDKLDASLAAILADQAKRSAGTNATIADLLNRKSSGDAAKDCAVISADSETPWNGWRN